MTTYTCDGCGEDRGGPRVVFTTEATDDNGLDVAVTKRWTTCPRCADTLFERIGRRPPWESGDATTIALPGDDQLGANAGGVAGPIGQ